MYTIGQVSEQFDLPVSTLRYYDKEGLFPALMRTSGIRRFGEQDGLHAEPAQDEVEPCVEKR